MDLAHPTPTAQGRGVPVVIGWHCLMVFLSVVATVQSVTLSEAGLNIVGIGLSVWLIQRLRQRSMRAVLPAGLDAILSPVTIIHDTAVWDLPGDMNFLAGLVMLPLVVVAIGIYLYVDRLRRHWYLT